MSLLTKKRRRIFVFGSNLAGRHGRGSALAAVQRWGAVPGMGIGLQGNSYAIPTKDYDLKVLPLKTIGKYVRHFLEFALKHLDDMEFEVVAIGCGLAGYKPEQIAPMFMHATTNVILPPEFERVIRDLPDAQRLTNRR